MEELKFALDTFYAVMAGALVMWMAAGFTMLEAGMVQKKDVSEIVTKNIGLYSIACIMYLLCGFALMYPSDAFANLLPAFGTSVGLSTSLANEDIGIPYGMDYSQQADFFFQVVFVATAMSIVSGAVAGRMKLLPFFIFAVVLTGFIYPVQGYWNWGGGFLSSGGYSDYAGSGTVHLCGAAAALAVVLVLGPRKGKYNSDGSTNPMPGSNIPMAALGVWILWLGWFGFNGGSELVVSNESAAIAVSQVFLNTNMAAAGGVVAAILTSLVLTGKMDVTMVTSIFPVNTRLVRIAATTPPAAAIFVFKNTWLTAIAALSLLTTSSDPPLKPNHPSHNIQTPNAAIGIFDPGIGLVEPSLLYFPFLGPNTSTTARAAAAPQR